VVEGSGLADSVWRNAESIDSPIQGSTLYAGDDAHRDVHNRMDGPSRSVGAVRVRIGTVRGGRTEGCPARTEIGIPTRRAGPPGRSAQPSCPCTPSPGLGNIRGGRRLDFLSLPGAPPDCVLPHTLAATRPGLACGLMSCRVSKTITVRSLRERDRDHRVDVFLSYNLADKGRSSA
jgi:hypothetical protein